MRRRATAIERFATLLKQSSTIPEVKVFREQARDVFRLGGADGLDSWIDARRDLGLLDDPLVARAASGLQSAATSAINEALGPLPEPKPRRCWQEQRAMLNARETKRRENLPPVGYRCSRKPKPKPRPKPRVQRQRPLSPTTTPDPKPMSLLDRMAADWDRLTPGERHD